MERSAVGILLPLPLVNQISTTLYQYSAISRDVPQTFHVIIIIGPSC